jgi:superfamily II DNA or RNA helicase
MTTTALRDYQQQAVDAVKTAWANGCRNVLGVAATGAGKTQILLALLHDELQANPERRALIIAHRKELIDQPVDRTGSWYGWNIPIGKVMASHDDGAKQIVVATIQTLSSTKRLANVVKYGAFDYVVIDEAHHANATTYQTLIRRLRELNPDLRHVGVTATPERSDGDGLSRMYEDVAFRVTIADLIRRRWLVQLRGLGIQTGISLQGVTTRGGDWISSELAKRFDTATGRQVILDAYKQYAAERQTIAFVSSVAGAHELAAAFRDEGYTAEAVDGTTPKPEREAILSRYRSGATQVLCNFGVLTEGFDAPGTSCIIMARPTKSVSVYMQCIGRGLRPAPREPAPGEPYGKALPDEDCLVLDFVPADKRDVVIMSGDVLGIPKELSDEAKKKKDELPVGEVEYGFTYNGDDFDTEGTPLQIVARQLSYLEVSPWIWFRRDDWLTLGFGTGDDGISRMLAITPPEGNVCRLFALWRRPKPVDPPNGRRPAWEVRQVMVDTVDAVYDRANELADRQARPALSAKDQDWQSHPATDRQINFLKQIIRGRARIKTAGMTKGEASQLTTYWQARRLIEALSVEALQIASQTAQEAA